jgi:hypothetical protein
MIFQDYIKIELDPILVNKINSIIDPFKNNTKEAVIYSFNENKTVKSDRRVSHKTSFRSDELTTIINQYISPLIMTLITLHNIDYNVTIGEQSFDYIKYDNGGYFDKHKDFIRINNPMMQQYTMLVGLTKSSYSYDGNTILWLPVDDLNREDYKILTETEETSSTLLDVMRKYNLPFNIHFLKKLIENTVDLIPYRINTYTIGKSLLFKSDIIHSGEEFNNCYNAKELLMFTINITGIEKTFEQDKIERFLNDATRISMFDKYQPIFSEKVFPFQIIVSKGKYNNKTFSDHYIKYLNFQDTIDSTSHMEQDKNILEQINAILISIYNKTKAKLNHRGRESHISSELLEESTNYSDIVNSYKYFDTTIILTPEQKEKIQIEIYNYVNNFIISNNEIITHTEKINNTWEESGCNDDGDEYEETAYLNCAIDIKFCFIKL